MSIERSRYDIAIVGAGPAGMATACLVGALNRNLKIVVLDKRPNTTRDHSLLIANDSIDAMSRVLSEGLMRPAACVNIEAANALLAQFKKWRGRPIKTSVVETTLAGFAKNQLNIGVHRESQFNIKAQATLEEDQKKAKARAQGAAGTEGTRAEAEEEQKMRKAVSFDEFLEEQTKGAQIIIGADGSKSEVRKAIGAKQIEELTLSYLLELKCKVSSKEFLGRRKIESSKQSVKAEGFDFETLSKPRSGEECNVVALHKFIDKNTYQSLIDGTSGTPERPWTMKELEKRANGDKRVKKMYDHLDNYLDGRSHWQDKVAAFPMKIYRSDCVARVYKERIVLLVGDASSGMILQRGVNKANKEAALCARAVLGFFAREGISEAEVKESQAVVALDTTSERDMKVRMEDPITLPPEFVQYQRQSKALFESERRWARAKSFGLKAGEFLLKLALLPFKIIFSPITLALYIYRWCKTKKAKADL